MADEVPVKEPRMVYPRRSGRPSDGELGDALRPRSTTVPRTTLPDRSASLCATGRNRVCVPFVQMMKVTLAGLRFSRLAASATATATSLSRRGDGREREADS